ncbi:MAG: YihY family inner membrane protein [Chitinophagaceae bacterium]|nr:YihY family inner membrane protein [Oligoflexus sp.]
MPRFVPTPVRNSTVFRYLRSLFEDANRVDIFKDAYAMAYVTLFSLIPSLAAIFALVSLFTPLFGENSSLLKSAEDFILKNLATGSGEQAITYLEGFLANTDFKKIGATGLVSTLVTLTLLLQQIEVALNRIFEVKVKRTMVQRFLYFWTILTLGTFSLAISVGTLSSFAWGSRYLELTFSQILIRDLVYWGGMFVLFLSIYKFGPNRHINVKNASVGAFASTVLLTQAIRFFSLYISHFTHYQAIYGALSALPIFLLWIYVMWLITLVGALVTKRSIEGLPNNAFHTTYLNDDIKSDYFQIILPFIVLIKTYEAFERAEPCTAEKLSKVLYVSSTVVQKAFSELLLVDLVLCRHNAGRKDGVEEFFPRFPSHKITFSKVKEKLLGDASLWLKAVAIEGDRHMTVHYQEALRKYLTAEEEILSTLGLAETKPLPLPVPAE